MSVSPDDVMVERRTNTRLRGEQLDALYAARRTLDAAQEASRVRDTAVVALAAEGWSYRRLSAVSGLSLGKLSALLGKKAA